MKKILPVLTLMLVLLAACQVQAKPDEVVRAAVEPSKTADIQKAMTYYTDDVVYTMVGLNPEPQVFRGKSELRKWLEQQYADGLAVQIHIDQVNGNQVAATTQFTTNFFRNLGIDWMECKEEYTVIQGKIQAWTCTVTQASLDKLVLAMTPKVAASDIAGKWKWVGEPPTYFVYNADGTYAMQRGIGDGLITLDAGQFTVKDSTLTLTTSENKYCATGTQGIYTISITEDGRLESTLVQDDCSERRPPEKGPAYLMRNP
jgi:hypothetical protein